MFIEFYWINRLIWLFLEFIIGIAKSIFNSSLRDKNVDSYTSLFYELISEIVCLFQYHLFYSKPQISKKHKS